MKCPKCGAELAEGIKFCPNCGKPIEKRKEQVETRKKKKTNWTVQIIVSLVLFLVLGVGLIFVGVWIPKVGFAPKFVNIQMGNRTLFNRGRFYFANPSSNDINDAIADINGTPWGKGYSVWIGTLPANGDTVWIDFFDFKKKGGGEFSTTKDIEKVEAYAIMKGKKVYEKVTSFVHVR